MNATLPCPWHGLLLLTPAQWQALRQALERSL
jgi:hypothetical protein